MTEKLDYERLVAQETLIFEATEEICRVMGPDQDSGEVTRKQLAERLGKSKGFVTQVLGGDRNMTLRTLADFAGALGHRVTIKLEPIPAEPGEKAAASTQPVPANEHPQVGGGPPRNWLKRLRQMDSLICQEVADWLEAGERQSHQALSQEQAERLKLVASGLEEVPELAADAPFLRSLATEGGEQ